MLATPAELPSGPVPAGAGEARTAPLGAPAQAAHKTQAAARLAVIRRECDGVILFLVSHMSRSIHPCMIDSTMAPLQTSFRRWEALACEHEAAVSEFAQAARRWAGEAWLLPLAPGKWSPAEVTSHVLAAYSVLLAELRGGPGLRLRGSPVARWLLRHTILRRILAGHPFPVGVRAPAETRPLEVFPDAESGIAALERGVAAFSTELAQQAALRRVRLTHTYFGALPARNALRLLTVHTRHHARQLALAGS